MAAHFHLDGISKKRGSISLLEPNPPNEEDAEIYHLPLRLSLVQSPVVTGQAAAFLSIFLSTIAARSEDKHHKYFAVLLAAFFSVAECVIRLPSRRYRVYF